MRLGRETVKGRVDATMYATVGGCTYCADKDNAGQGQAAWRSRGIWRLGEPDCRRDVSAKERARHDIVRRDSDEFEHLI